MIVTLLLSQTFSNFETAEFISILVLLIRDFILFAFIIMIFVTFKPLDSMKFFKFTKELAME